MTKMATMLKNAQNIKNFREPLGQLPLNFLGSIRVYSNAKFVNHDPG